MFKRFKKNFHTVKRAVVFLNAIQVVIFSNTEIRALEFPTTGNYIIIEGTARRLKHNFKTPNL